MRARKKQLPTRHYSRKQEVAVAKALGGKTVSNSGATKFDKGDVKTDTALFECKTKTSKQQQITIKREWLTGIKEEAIGERKDIYGLIVDFGDSEQYAVMPIKFLKQFLELDAASR